MWNSQPLGLLLLASTALSFSFDLVDNDSDDGTFQMSAYHRKLMVSGTGKSAKGMPPAPKPLSLLEARKFWPKWWNESMEAKLQDEVLIGIIATAYVGLGRHTFVFGSRSLLTRSPALLPLPFPLHSEANSFLGLTQTHLVACTIVFLINEARGGPTSV